MQATRGRLVVETVLLVVAVAALASSVVFIRFSRLTPGEISGWRMLFGGLCFLPFVGGGWRALPMKCWSRAAIAGIFLALHFIFWVMGARATAAANATLLVNFVPLVLPFLLLMLAGEPIRRQDWMGSLLGLAGVLVLVGSNLGEGGTWRGDVICLGAMVLMAVYMAMGRWAGGLFPNTASWVVPVFLTSALTSFGVNLLMGGDARWPPADEWKWIALVVVGPTLLGHGMMARSLRFWRGQVVGVASGGQFIFASLYGWFAFGELPSIWFPLGAGLIVCGVWVVAGKANDARSRQGATEP